MKWMESLLDRKRAAGMRAVPINPAAVFIEKHAGLHFIVGHAQQHLREMTSVAQHQIGVAIQENVRGHSQPLLEAQDIVGLKKKI